MPKKACPILHQILLKAITERKTKMRLDKFLKVSRVIKRRTVANEACDTDHVTVNGKKAKASYDVKMGDIVAVTYGERTLKFRVLDIREHTAKADASSLYEIIEE